MRSDELMDALTNPTDNSQQFIDDQIVEIIKKQEELGLEAITDGELRYKLWDYGFFFGFNGVEKVRIESGSILQEDETFTDLMRLNARIGFNPEHPALAAFEFLKNHVGEGHFPRVTMPSPALFFLSLLRDPASYAGIYESTDQMADDIVAAYRETIKALYDAGCRSIKMDDPTWGFIYDNYYLPRFIAGGFDIKHLLETLVKINTEALAGTPDDMQRIIFVCRHSHSHIWTAEPDYNEFAQYAFDNPNADAFIIDTGLKSDFKFLDDIDKNKDICLGLSDPWTPMLVEPEDIKISVARAAEHFPLERLSISPRSGFRSRPGNTNAFEPEDQWRKLGRLMDIAKEIWP